MFYLNTKFVELRSTSSIQNYNSFWLVRYIIFTMYLKKSNGLIIWDGAMKVVTLINLH